MPRWRTRQVLSCSLLLAAAALATSSYAMPQEQQVGATSDGKSTEAKTNSSSDKVSPEPPDQPPEKPAYQDNAIGLRLVKNLAKDQFAMWTSPAHIKLADADWLFPLGIATGALLATDTET